MESSLIAIMIDYVGRIHRGEGEVHATREIREEGSLSGVMATITSMITTPLMDFLSKKDDKTIQQEVAEDHPSGADAAILEDGVTREGRVKIKIAYGATSDEEHSGTNDTVDDGGGGKATSIQRGSGQVTTEGGGGKATTVGDGGGNTTSMQGGSDQATTDGGGGKATVVRDGGENTTSEEKWERHDDVKNNNEVDNAEQITEKITRCENKEKIVGDTGCDTEMFAHSKNTDGETQDVCPLQEC
jgi:hypothetical protein